jgi:hypothetical protein
MRAAALILSFTLLAAGAAHAAEEDAEPLPPGAPTEAYPLAAWCYGALSEYLDVYDRVKPDLRAIDKMFGSSVPNEKEPYASDMAAAREELKKIAHAVQSAEQASPKPIAPQGVEAINQGRGIWRPAELKTQRELARAWLTWALPDRCDSNAKELAASSALLGQALKYNNPSAVDAPAPAAPEPAADTTPAATPPSSPPAPAAADATPPATPPSSPPAPAAEPEPASTASTPPPEPTAPAPAQDAAPQGPPPIGGYNSYLTKPSAPPSSDMPAAAPPAETPKSPGG